MILCVVSGVTVTCCKWCDRHML